MTRGQGCFLQGDSAELLDGLDLRGADVERLGGVKEVRSGEEIGKESEPGFRVIRFPDDWFDVHISGNSGCGRVDNRGFSGRM